MLGLLLFVQFVLIAQPGVPILSKKTYLAITLLLAGGLLAAWFAFTSSPPSLSNSPSDISDLGAEAPISVKVKYARKGTLVLHLTANGYTKAIRHVPFMAQVGGVVDSLTIYEGKAVRESELLLKLEDADYRFAVAEAQEQLNQAIIAYGQQRAERMNTTVRVDTLQGYYLDLRRAERSYQQAQSDYAAGTISQEELLLFKSEYEAAKIFAEDSKQKLIASRTGLSKAMISLRRAETNLARTRMCAPFSGMIANLKVALEQPVNIGAECFTLINLDTSLLEVDILESEAPQVQMGRRATATFVAFPNKIFEGRVVAINPLVDLEKRVRRTVVAISNKDHKLFPGLYAQVKIESQFLTERLIVPKDAIVLRDQRKVVFIVRSGGEGKTDRFFAKWCYVETGAENEEDVEVLASALNLQAGEPVIVTNHFTMAHDTAVRVE